MTGPREPLERISSLKVKLGFLVAASVLTAAVLATAGAGSVPAALGIPVTVLLALGVTQLLAVGMTSPLRQMTEAARRMAGGDYGVRVETSSRDEVGELARAFNRMAADLETVDRQRRDLVATVSHELRTPLTALVAVLENLDDGVTAPAPETIRTALRQAERLSDLVRDLLDLSRIEAGAVRLDREEVAVTELLAECVAEARAAQRDVEYDVRVQPPGLRLVADRARLHQLLANLLDNASRHSPPRGTITVRADRRGPLVRIEVADEGPGIPPAEREHVFERFGASTDQTGGGTGLGLAIARWVADLHGGTISVVESTTQQAGACLRVDLPSVPTAVPTAEQAVEPTGAVPAPAGASAAPASSVVAPPLVDTAFGDAWPDRGVPARPRVLLACLAIGVLAGVSMPFERPGLAATAVLLASGMLVLVVGRGRRTPFTWACAVLAAGFAVMFTIRDAEWVVFLGLCVGGLLTTAALTSARSAWGVVVGAAAWPFAGLRGMPWLGRTLRAVVGGSHAAAVARTATLSVLGVIVFGLLFASGDAVFGEWMGRFLPDLGSNLVLRLFVAVAVAGVVLAAAYLAINPPTVDGGARRRPVQHRYEWLAPVLLIDAVFLLFLLAQAAAFVGGHDYVRRTTGLTYADYVHQGFAQLTVATLLMLLVVWAAGRKSRLDTAADRWWLRGSLGALCLLTLVVVASALHRMGLYQDAYGFTRLRLLVDLFEAWLGLLVLAVLVAGIRLKGDWLPRASLLSGAGLLLGLALVNPDAWIARHNVERFEATGKVDWAYLQGLSADATPILVRLPREQAACALAGHAEQTRSRESWTTWNLGRQRAREAVRGLDLSTECRLASSDDAVPPSP